jgi:hypothetical protein
MPQVFHPAFNTISRVSIFGAVFVLAGVVWLAGVYVRSPYATGAGVILEQPIPFSHQHHVGDCGIDCRYCHTGVETSSFAGIPPTATCMNCHAELWRDSPMLAPVRESFRSGTPLVWRRVHDLPDFAYFDHSIHVHKGIACSVCHGRVDRMPLLWREATLHMEWCLDCHRDPERFVGRREEVFSTASPSEVLPAAARRELAGNYDVKSKTDCSVCHR